MKIDSVKTVRASILLSVCLFALSSALSFAQQTNSPILANIDLLGASNTNGTGASLPLDARLKAHLMSVLSTMPSRDQKALTEKKILIAADYFFHTNFRILDNPEAQHDELFESLVRGWAERYDLVIIGQLPLPSDLNLNAQRALLNMDITEPPNGLFSSLTRGGFLKQSRVVNATLKKLSRKGALPKDNVVLVPHELFFNATLGYPAKGIAKLDAKSLFSDSFHFNDRGQAAYINIVLLPVLSRELSLSRPIEKLKEVDVESEQIVEIYKSLSLGKEDFVNRKTGTYFGIKLDPKQHNIENALLEISPSEVIDASDTEALYKAIEKIDDEDRVADIHFLRGIALLIHLGSISEESPVGIPVSWRESQNDTDSPVLMLNLVQQLAYLNFPLLPTEPTNSRALQFQSWGSDYWKSYGWVFGNGVGGKLFRQSLPTLNADYRKDVPELDVPGTNYFWNVDVNPTDPTRISVTHVVFPMLRHNNEIQAVPTERLATISPPWLERVENLYPSQVKLIYKFDLEIIDNETSDQTKNPR